MINLHRCRFSTGSSSIKSSVWQSSVWKRLAISPFRFKNIQWQYISYVNMMKIGPVTPEITRVTNASFWMRRKNRHISPNMSTTTEPIFANFLARDVIYTSRSCYDVSVRLFVRLSVTEVHWRIIANLGFKFRSKFTSHCGRGEE